MIQKGSFYVPHPPPFKKGLSQIRYLRQPPHEKAEGRLFHGRNFPVFASQKRQNGGVQPPKEKTWGVSTKCETHLRHPLFSFLLSKLRILKRLISGKVAYDDVLDWFNAALECPNMMLPDLSHTPEYFEEIIPAKIRYEGTTAEWNRIFKLRGEKRIPALVICEDRTIETYL